MSRTLSIVLIIFATLLLLVTNFGIWIETGILNESSFVDITVNTFEEEDVRMAIAEGIVDAALADRPQILNIVRDRASEVIAVILGSSIVQGIIELASGRIFDLIVDNNGNRVAINLEPIKNIIFEIVDLIAPDDAGSIQVENIPDEVVILDEGEIPSIQSISSWIGWITFIAGFVSIGLFILVLWKGWATANRNSYLKWTGGSIAIGAAIFLVLTLTAGTTIVLIIDNSTGDVVISEAYGNLVRQFQAQLISLIVLGIGIWLIGWWAIREIRNASLDADQVESAPVGGQLPEVEASGTP